MPDPADPARSHTHGGAKALARAAEHGIAIVLHGHLHRPSARRIIMPAGTVLNIGAGTSLCERERGAGSSFNLIDFEMGSARITDMRWDGMHYAPHPAGTFTLDTAAGNQRRAHTF
jgi:predicted phosphodiesterase